jgi:hypothetical protein
MSLGTKHARLGVSIALLAIAGVFLGGCSGVQGGSDSTSVTRTVDQADEFSATEIEHHEISKTFGSTELVIIRSKYNGNVKSGAGSVRLARYLLEAGYAVNEHKPTSGIRVILQGYRGQPLGLALKESGWQGVVYEESEPGRFFVNGAVLENKLGKWPGRMPETAPH